MTRIVDGKGRVSSNIHYMRTGESSEPTILYMKQGWENMPMTKTVALFNEDSELGPPLSTTSATTNLEAMRADLDKKVEKAKAEKADGEKVVAA